jgi:hypothetical protein
MVLFPVPIPFRNGFIAGAIVAVIVGTYLFQLWQPERQIQLHTAHLLRQIEKRNWSNVRDFLAADYRDAWNADREQLLERLRVALNFTRDLRITAINPQIGAAGETGRWSARIEVHGSGEMASLVQERVSSLEAPFVLDWRQESWRPWEWRLVHAGNQALEGSGWSD